MFPFNLEPKPQIQIHRVPQHNDAWCYAAAAEMIVNYLFPEDEIRQCRVASFVKQPSNCCGQGIDDDCVDSGCSRVQVSEILEHFHVSFERKGRVELAELRAEVTAEPGRLVEVLIDWDSEPGVQSSHVVLIAGVIGEHVYVVDPLGDEDSYYYGGWQSYQALASGFGLGAWARTWVGLAREE